MNRDLDAPDGAGTAAPIDLVREAPFALGHLTVTPATLSIDAAGWSRHLEPRVMQVLVVLARAAPAVVGRRELNARVWGGRVVGDDAINRAVQVLRRLASDAPPPAPFRIHTVPRVGYRLTAAQSDEADEPGGAGQAASAAIEGLRSAGSPGQATDAAMPAAPPRWPRRRWAAVAVPVAVLALFGWLVGWRPLATHPQPPATWTVERSTTLADLPTDARDVTLSPDGRRLAYRAIDAEGRGRIFVRAAGDGSAGAPVSPPGIDARRPAWSPDGATLAFAGYDPTRPCRLFTAARGRAAVAVGGCETVRDPRLTWSGDGRSLLFGDAPGENAVQRISAIRLADGRRSVLTSPPGDSLGDGLPIPRGRQVVFQRQYAWADEGWIARDLATGAEQVLWRRGGVAGSVAAVLPDGTLAVAWTRAGASQIDFVAADRRVRAQPIVPGSITALAAVGMQLLVETDHSETSLVRAGATTAAAVPLMRVRGRLSAPVLLPDGRLRAPVLAGGAARIWQREPGGTLRPWGSFVAARIFGLALSPDAALTAALVTGDAGREIVVFDAAGRPIYRWDPHARSLNAAAWTGDGRHLIAPVLDGAGWRLFQLDPLTGAPPRDLGRSGFAVVANHGSALYAIRAGETTEVRELWRLDGQPRRLPFDLTLFDIVNWRVTADGVWLPDRSDRDRPRLLLRDSRSGRIVRSVASPGLAGAGSGLAADDRGPVYVQMVSDAPDYSLLTLSATEPPKQDAAR